ncbi:MAG: hypothetical protein HC767_01725 [Akkermansiaceae bacterium]|nr:hypothetical protein [Akkermansiaceae bacterium]
MYSILSRLSSSPVVEYKFSNGNVAKAIQLSDTVERLGKQGIRDALAQMGLPCSQHPVLVLIGGANGAAGELKRLPFLFENILAPIAQEMQAIVVDGGTDSGVMRLMGHARASIGATFPLVGVCPGELVNLRGLSTQTRFSQSDLSDRVALEPHHTHFFLVPGFEWGAESKYFAKLATTIAQGQPSLAVLVNGGNISLDDAKKNIAEGRPLVVITNTGRLADEIAGANSAKHKALHDIRGSEYLNLLDINEGDQLRNFLRQQLSDNRLN